MEVERSSNDSPINYPELVLAAEPIQAILERFRADWYPLVQLHLHPLRELAKFFYDDPLAAPFRNYATKIDEHIMQMLQAIAMRTQFTVYFRLEHEPPEWLQRHGINYNNQNPSLIYRSTKFRALAKDTAKDNAAAFKKFREDFTSTCQSVALDEVKALFFSERFEKRRRAMDLIPPPRQHGIAFFAWMLLFGPPVGREPLEMASGISTHVKGVIALRLMLLDLVGQLEQYWATLASLDHGQITKLSVPGLEALYKNRQQAANAHGELSRYLMTLCPKFVGVKHFPDGDSRKTDIPGWPASLYTDPDLDY